MRALLGPAALAVALGACAGSEVLAPVGRAPDPRLERPRATGIHRVEAGDTLYSIAWRYGLDYRDIARWNAIPQPYTIHPGQRLRVAGAPTARAAASPQQALPPRAGQRRGSRAESTPRGEPATVAKAENKATSAPARDARPVRHWRWPARGKVIGEFGAGGGKGIDIQGRLGDDVKAAAPGRVVYSGSGLRGYGKLIIVKHDKRYLSAYAHNHELHVNEGDTVKSGQRIAEMGSTGSNRIKLHFEIRRDGKPVDPLQFLPR